MALRWIDPPFTAFMIESRMGALFSRQPGYEFRHEWRDWDRISKNAALAVVASEDQLFPDHNGFDFKQIDKALEARERGRRVRGASTISQQVAKNLFLWPGPELGAQGTRSRDHRADRGMLGQAAHPRGLPERRGIRARHLRRAGREPPILPQGRGPPDRSDAALLAAVLPAPKRFKVDAPSRYVRYRQAWIVRQMASLGGTSYLAQLR